MAIPLTQWSRETLGKLEDPGDVGMATIFKKKPPPIPSKKSLKWSLKEVPDYQSTKPSDSEIIELVEEFKRWSPDEAGSLLPKDYKKRLTIQAKGEGSGGGSEQRGG